jgi:hypothetical protein
MALETRQTLAYKDHTLDRVLEGPDPRWESLRDGVRILATQHANDETWTVVVTASGGKISAVANGASRDDVADSVVLVARAHAQTALTALAGLAARAR